MIMHPMDDNALHARHYQRLAQFHHEQLRHALGFLLWAGSNRPHTAEQAKHHQSMARMYAQKAAEHLTALLIGEPIV